MRGVSHLSSIHNSSSFFRAIDRSNKTSEKLMVWCSRATITAKHWAPHTWRKSWIVIFVERSLRHQWPLQGRVKVTSHPPAKQATRHGNIARGGDVTDRGGLYFIGRAWVRHRRVPPAWAFYHGNLFPHNWRRRYTTGRFRGYLSIFVRSRRWETAQQPPHYLAPMARSAWRENRGAALAGCRRISLLNTPRLAGRFKAPTRGATNNTRG